MTKSSTKKTPGKKASETSDTGRHKSDMLMSEDMEQDLLFDHAQEYGAGERPEDFHRKKTSRSAEE